jgi:transcriptional regulator with XRE-family HTH domain
MAAGSSILVPPPLRVITSDDSLLVGPLDQGEDSVPAAPHSPIMRRRRLGVELRRLREQAGLTGEQVVGRLGWASASKLSRLENGRSRPDLGDVLDLLDLYAVEQPVRDELVRVARDAGDVRRWLRAYPVMTQRQRRYAELEAGCAEIREYAPSIVPGLLQTPDYARARITSAHGLMPAEGRPAEHPEAEVGARIARQSLLTRPLAPPQYAAVIDEAALGPRSGPPEVLRGQLARLAEVAVLPNVTVQVLPNDAVVHDFYLPQTAFSLYRFADPQDPETLMIEGLTTDLMLTDRTELDRYATVFRWLQDAALPPDETLSWLQSRLGDPAAGGRGTGTAHVPPPAQPRDGSPVQPAGQRGE